MINFVLQKCIYNIFLLSFHFETPEGVPNSRLGTTALQHMCNKYECEDGLNAPLWVL